MSGLSVGLLAGGRSTRMGQNKALVTLAGRPLIEHVLDRVRGIDAREIILITNEPELYTHLELPCFPDEIPGKGALGGVYTALRRSQCSHTLVIACDMPFVSTALLRYMDSLRAEIDCDAIVPRVAGRPQGLLAIYRRTCLDAIAESLCTDQLKVISFYDRITVNYLDEADYAAYDPRGHSFFNVNTPEHLETVRLMLLDDGSQAAPEE